MLDLTRFYSPTGATRCSIRMDARELVIGVGSASFTFRGRRVVIRWHTLKTGDELRAVDVGDVVAVRSGPGERSAIWRRTGRLEVTLRGKEGREETVVVCVREPAASTAWAEARLREALGHVVVDRAWAEQAEGLEPLVKDGTVLGRERDGVAVMRVGTRPPWLFVRADAGGLRADVMGSAADRSFAWPAGSLFEIGPRPEEWDADPEDILGNHEIYVRFVDGGRVVLADNATTEEAVKAADLLARAAGVPNRREWARRFLAGGGDFGAGAGVAVPGGAPDAGTPVLSYARPGAEGVLVTRRDGRLTLVVPPLPAPRAWALWLAFRWRVLLLLPVACGIAARSDAALVGVAAGVVAGLWALAAALSGIGRRVALEVAGGVLTMRVETKTGRGEHRWRAEAVVDVSAAWNRVVLRTRDGLAHALVHRDDPRDVREIVHLLGAAMGLRPAGQPPDADPLPPRRPVRRRQKPRVARSAES